MCKEVFGIVVLSFKKLIFEVIDIVAIGIFLKSVSNIVLFSF